MRITGNGIWGEPVDRPGALKVLQQAVELGVNFIDTADSYGPDVSEQLIAEALLSLPERPGDRHERGLRAAGPRTLGRNGLPGHLRAACEGSLRRLRVERIDLYQLHRIDPKVAAEDQLGTLKDLVAEGKIKHVGLSEVSVRQIEFAPRSCPSSACRTAIACPTQNRTTC